MKEKVLFQDSMKEKGLFQDPFILKQGEILIMK